MGDHYSVFTQLDFSGEKSLTRIYNGAITAVSIAGFLTEFGQMKDAINAITLGTMAQEMWVGDNTDLSNVLPTNVFAQRELKWLVVYEDDTSKNVYTLTLPCADPTGRLIAGTDLADLAQTEVAAFVTRFESFARSPESDVNTVTVLRIQLVGRNI